MTTPTSRPLSHLLWSVALAIAALGRPLAAQSEPSTASTERDYRAVLEKDPRDSRSLYMLAQLRADHPREAVELLERYTALVPRDAWGYIALGQAFGRAGDVGRATAAFDAADRLAPNERDVYVGRARMLVAARHTDDAIDAYAKWTVTHRADAEAHRELAAQYRRAGRSQSAIAALEHAQRAAPDARTARQLDALRAHVAPRAEPLASGSRDSDANSVMAAGGVAGFTVGDGVDLSLGGGVRRSSDGLTTLALGDGRIGLAWAPAAAVRFDASAALVFASSDTSTVPQPTPGRGQGRGPLVASSSSTEMFPTARARLTWRQPEGRARIDLRASHFLLDASPLLVRNRVRRSEVGGEGEVHVAGPLALRGLARFAAVQSLVDDNSRVMLGARVVGALPGGGEITVGGQQISYAHASTAGYFAPKIARTLEIGAYRETESDNGVTLAVDLGAGGQQVQDWGVAGSSWAPALRGWAALGVPLAPSRELRFELEAYDARLGGDAVTTGSRWRYGSASISLRWSLR